MPPGHHNTHGQDFLTDACIACTRHDDTCTKLLRPCDVMKLPSVKGCPCPCRCRQHSVLVNRGWVPPSWKTDWHKPSLQQQQPQGPVTVTGVVQGSEQPSEYVPKNDPQAGSFFWMDVGGLVSDAGSSSSSRQTDRQRHHTSFDKTLTRQAAVQGRWFIPLCVP
jgi:hypothetical protein